jgi:hypothetical protein
MAGFRFRGHDTSACRAKGSILVFALLWIADRYWLIGRHERRVIAGQLWDSGHRREGHVSLLPFGRDRKPSLAHFVLAVEAQNDWQQSQDKNGACGGRAGGA